MRTSRLCWYSERAISAAVPAASSAACNSGEGFMKGLQLKRHISKPCATVARQRGVRSLSMGNRLTKIYTRTGDDGSTGLGNGARVPKEDPRVEAYGTVDEANCAIGVVL